MSLSYTTGNPSNLTAGATASMTDISGPFTDIKTFLTDGSGAVGDTILASPTNGVWRTVTSGTAASTGAQITTTPSWFTVTGSLVPSGSTSVAAPDGVWIPPTSGDVAVASKTTRLRIRVHYIVNATPPAITITWGLYPITVVAGGASILGLTLGTVIAGSTASVASPATGVSTATGSSFDFSAVTGANGYMLGVVGNGSQAASSYVSTTAFLEMRHT